MGILNCSNEGPGPLQRGDNYKNAKKGWVHLKIFFSRTTGPGKFKFTRKLPDIVQIQDCSNYCPQGSGGATVGENIFTCVYIGKMFKNLLLKNH
jgi:hypothetical protein